MGARAIAPATPPPADVRGPGPAGRGSSKAKDVGRDPGRPDRPRPGPAARGVRRGGPRPAGRVAQGPRASSSRSGCAGTRAGGRTSSSCGERRWRAAQLAGLPTLTCVIVDGADRPGRAAGRPARRERPARGPQAGRAGPGLPAADGRQRLVGPPAGRASSPSARPSVVRALALLDLPAPGPGGGGAGGPRPVDRLRGGAARGPAAQAAMARAATAEGSPATRWSGRSGP